MKSSKEKEKLIELYESPRKMSLCFENNVKFQIRFYKEKGKKKILPNNKINRKKGRILKEF